MLVLLGEAAVTYSPRQVIWTGASIAVVWSLAFLFLYEIPDSKQYSDMTSQQSDDDLLTLFLNPTYVSLPQWLMQLSATGMLTALLAIAVHMGTSRVAGAFSKHAAQLARSSQVGWRSRVKA